MNTPLRTLPALVAACLGLACVAPAEPLDELEAREHMANLDAAEIEDVESVTLSVDSETCTLEARPAVLVSVLQPLGDVIGPVNGEATVLYRHWTGEDWSEVREAYCLDADCALAAVGYGTSGVYTIGAFACGDSQVTMVEVGETADGCHVETVHASLVLDEVAPVCYASDEWVNTGEGVGLTPAPQPGDTVLAPDPAMCPSRAKSPSVIAMTGVIEGDIVWPTTPTTILSQHESEEQATPMTCIDEDCSTFLAGWDQPGEFEISAEICGTWIDDTVEVEETADGCHVDTAWVSMFVDADSCDHDKT